MPLKRHPLLAFTVSATLLLPAGLTVATSRDRSGQRPGQTADPTPSPLSDSQRLISEGTALHDRGDYGGAIRKYRQALNLDPENVMALYELAYSLYASRELRASLEVASQGVKRESKVRPLLYMLLGNIQDELKEPQKAIESYHAGLLEGPNLPLLHFNLGVAYRGVSALPKARICFQNSLALDPKHPSSHYWLGRTYMEEGYRVPAILALTRFLLLETSSQRSEVAIGWLDEMFRWGVKTDAKGNSQITIDPNARKDEGDFSAADLGVPILQLSGKLTAHEAKDSSPPEVRRLADFLAIVAETGPEILQSGWAARFYVPYFIALKERGHGEAYAHYVLQRAKLPRVGPWIAGHKQAVEEMLRWSAGFRWESVRSPVSLSSKSTSPADFN